MESNLLAIELKRCFDFNFVADVTFSEVHSPLGAVDLELGIDDNGLVSEFRLNWNLYFDGFIEHRELAGDGGFAIAVFDLGGLEGDLWMFADVEEVWILQVICQLCIV